MPFIYNFEKAKMKPVEVLVNPEGWKTPLTVEYVIDQAHNYDTMVSVIWRIKGTSHCFTIYEIKLNQLSNGDYKAHFEEVLRNFRIDYENWFTDPDYANADWKYEYQRQFDKYIIYDASTGEKGQN